MGTNNGETGVSGWTIGNSYSRQWLQRGSLVWHEVTNRGVSAVAVEGVVAADRAGTVTIEGTAQVGVALAASLSDPDGSVTGLTWQWSRSDDADGTGSVAVVATTVSYRPVVADLGKYLTATAGYDDGHGTGKTAAATTAAVLAAAVTNAAPSFTGTAASRSITENATSGDVGEALTATDADGDTLAYSVAATADADAGDHLAAFNRDFSLDTEDGQITVKTGRNRLSDRS